jgi:hypothetical protein
MMRCYFVWRVLVGSQRVRKSAEILTYPSTTFGYYMIS